MTRDQAILNVNKVRVCGYTEAALHIDTLVALGVLKLDPPKDDQDEFLDLLFKNCPPGNQLVFSYHTLRQAFIDAGVKIVKK